MIYNATYVSVWDGDTEIRTDCKWDDERMVAFDIGMVDVSGIESLDREYVELPDGREINVDSYYRFGDVDGDDLIPVEIEWLAEALQGELGAVAEVYTTENENGDTAGILVEFSESGLAEAYGAKALQAMKTRQDIAREMVQAPYTLEITIEE